MLDFFVFYKIRCDCLLTNGLLHDRIKSQKRIFRKYGEKNMTELKHLAAKSINIKEYAVPMQTKEEILPFGENFPVVTLRSKFDAEHFSLFIKNKQIPFDKASQVSARKVLHGTFKGCYVIIDRENYSHDNTRVFLLHQNGYVQIADERIIITDEEVDLMITKDYVARVTAEKLNTFDLGHENQAYRYFLEKLPRFLFAESKYNFENNVFKHFFAGDVKLIPHQNNRFVKTELCKREAYDFFTDYCQKILDEEKESAK